MRTRLTFDANPKELASRRSGSILVSLLWSRRTHRAAVVVADEETGETTELDVLAADDPLDLYEHALAYAPRRGHQGWAPRTS